MNLMYGLHIEYGGHIPMGPPHPAHFEPSLPLLYEFGYNSTTSEEFYPSFISGQLESVAEMPKIVFYWLT